jgi:hypothetical protein
VLVPAPVLAKRLFLLWKDHNCLDGAGVGGGGGTLYASRSAHVSTGTGTCWWARFIFCCYKNCLICKVLATVALFFLKTTGTHVSIRKCRNRYRYPLNMTSCSVLVSAAVIFMFFDPHTLVPVPVLTRRPVLVVTRI